MPCLTQYYLIALENFAKKVEVFSLVPPPPPPPPPPENISIAEYMTQVSKWDAEEMQPAIKEACE